MYAQGQTAEQLPFVDHPWKERLELLLADPLLAAMNAGWATKHDLEFIAPILLNVQKALINASHIEGHVDGKLLTTLSRLGISESSDNGTLPSCAKFFINSTVELWRGRPAQANRALAKIILQLSALSIAAMEKTLTKAGADVAAEMEMNGSGDGDVIDAFLKLQMEFISDLLTLMRFHRLNVPIERIQSRRSLELAEEPPIALYPGVGEIMFSEEDERRSIEFTVERYPCTAEVLDPRVVRIPVGKYNNRHVHAHETLFMFLSGTGEILVGETWVKVKGGDAVFCPRWAVHQTHNTGEQELVLLAITDYYLTHQVYVGKYDKI